jgi:hypothetical protein
MRDMNHSSDAVQVGLPQTIKKRMFFLRAALQRNSGATSFRLNEAAAKPNGRKALSSNLGWEV